MDIHSVLSQINVTPTNKGVWDSALGNTQELNYQPIQQVDPVDYDGIAKDVREKFSLPEVSPSVKGVISSLRTQAVAAPQTGWQDVFGKVNDGSKRDYVVPTKQQIENSGKLFKDTRTPFTERIVDDMTYKDWFGNKAIKYDTYAIGRDNETVEALKQSGIGQWAKGLTAMGMKTLVHAVGGTAGVAYGLVDMIAEGNLRAFYDNDFAKYLDDLNKTIDDNLAIYKTQEEKNMNFWQKMWTNSFWAKDVTDAGAFVLGAIVVGKGTGLITRALPKVALRAAVRGGQASVRVASTAAETAQRATMMSRIKEPVRSLMRSVFSGKNSGEAIINAYEAGSRASRFVKAGNTAMQVTMSAVYEAGVESRQALESMKDNYLKQYREFHGKEPSGEEFAEFMDDAAKKANYVFMANVPLVAIGNYATIGKIMKWQTPKFLERLGKVTNPLRWGEKTALTGVVAAEGGKFAQTNLSKGLPKFLKHTYSYLQAPIKEGLVEEGGQNFVSTFAKNYMAAKYDPEAAKQNLSFMDEMFGAFKHAYGTKEGWDEIGMGMLIGFLGEQSGRVSQSEKKSRMGRLLDFFGNEYSDQIRKGGEFVDAYNKAVEKGKSGWISEEQLDVFNRLENLNRQVAAEGRAEVSDNEREAEMTRVANIFSQYAIARQYGMGDFVQEQLEAQIDGLSKDDMLSAGISEENHEAYKKFLKEESARQHNINKKAFDIAEELQEGLLTSENLEKLAEMNISSTDLLQMTAMELALGYNSASNVVNLSKQLQTLFNDPEAGSAIVLSQHLSNAKRKQLLERDSLTTQKEGLLAKQKELEDVLVRERDKSRTLTKEKDIQNNAETKNSKLNDTLAELLEVERSLREVETKLEANAHRQTKLEEIDADSLLGGITKDLEGFWNTNSEADIDASVKKLKQLEEVVKSVKEELNDPETSEDRKSELSRWLNNYASLNARLVQNVEAYRTLHRNFVERTNPRYAFSKFSKEFKFSKNRKIENDKLDDTFTEEEKEQFKQLNELIENSELSSYQAYQLRANFKLLLNQQRGAIWSETEVNRDSLLKNKEVVTDSVWKRYQENNIDDGLFENIALKLFSNVALSERERKIYVDNAEKIRSIVEKLQLEKGDPVSYGHSSGQEVNTTIDRSISFKEAVKKIIDSFISSTNRLSKELVDKAKGNKPTEQEYERFRELHRKKTGRDAKGKMTDKATREKYKREFEDNIEEYEALRDKINTWGVMMGTIANGVRLSDLLEFYDSLENETDQNSPDDVIKQTEINIDELLDEEESSASWQSTNKGRNFDVAQVYDLAMVSVNRDGNFVLHHFGIDNLLQEINDSHPNDSVEVFGVNDIGNTRTPYRAGTNNTFDGVEIRITKPDGSSETFTVRFDKQNNLVFSDALVPHLGSLRLMQIPSIRRNYQPLYRENGNGSFEQVKSTFDGGVDTNATREVKVGDTLTAEVDLDNPYNRRLFNNYHKALADNNGNAKAQAVVDAREALKNQMVVNLVDSKGRVVSVMKSNATAQDLQESATAPQMIDYRNKAVTQVINGVGKKGSIGGVVKLNNKMSVTVNSVMLGVPNVTVARDSEGNVGVTLNTLSQQAKKKVVDVGYMLDGKIHSKNHTKITAGHNLLGQCKKAEHKGSKIPLIFVKEDGKVVAYPAHLQSQGNLLQQFDDIIANNDPVQAAIKLNELMHQNGISTQLFGITPDMVSNNSSELEMARKMAEKAEKFNDPETWVGNTHTMEEILDRDIQVNLDMEGDAFAAPKLRFKFDGSIKPAQTIATLPSTSNSVSQIVPPAPPATPSAPNVPNTPNTPNTPTPPSTPNTPNTPNNKGKKKGKKGENKTDENKPYKEYVEGAPSFEYNGKKYNVVTYGERNTVGFVEEGSDVILKYDSFYRDLGFQIAANKWADTYDNGVQIYVILPEQITAWEQQQQQPRPENEPITPPLPPVTPQSVEEGQQASQAVGNALSEIEEEDKQNGNQDNSQDPSKDKFFDGVIDYTPNYRHNHVDYGEAKFQEAIDGISFYEGFPYQISETNGRVIGLHNYGQGDTGTDRSCCSSPLVRDVMGGYKIRSWVYLASSKTMSRDMVEYKSYSDNEDIRRENVSLPVAEIDDSDMARSKQVIDEFIGKLEEKISKGNVVILPLEGLGIIEGGHVGLVQNSPNSYRYLIEQLQEHLNLNDNFLPIKNMKWGLYQSQVLGKTEFVEPKEEKVEPKPEGFVDRATSFIRNLFGRRNRSC